MSQDDKTEQAYLKAMKNLNEFYKKNNYVAASALTSSGGKINSKSSSSTKKKVSQIPARLINKFSISPKKRISNKSLKTSKNAAN